MALLASISVDSSLGFSLTATLGGMLFSTDGDKLSTATGDAVGVGLGFDVGCSDGLFEAKIGFGFSVTLGWTGKAVGDEVLPSIGSGTLKFRDDVGPEVLLFKAVSVTFPSLFLSTGCIVGTWETFVSLLDIIVVGAFEDELVGSNGLAPCRS